MTRAPLLASLTLFALFAILASASSCTEEAIVLATVPTTEAGAPSAPVRCVDIKGCPAETFCAKPSCSATTGTCERFPIVCDQPEAPVCGCDAITYFNDCLRQAAGIVASTPGECRDDGTSCASDGILACPDPSTQSCALFLPAKGPCPHDIPIPGTCWVLPATCPEPSSAPDRWDSCADDVNRCVDTCTAIRSGKIYRRASECPPN